MKGEVLCQPRTFNLPGIIMAGRNPGDLLIWKYAGGIDAVCDIGRAEEDIEDIVDSQNTFLKSLTQKILDDPFLQSKIKATVKNSGSAPKFRAWLSRMIAKLQSL